MLACLIAAALWALAVSLFRAPISAIGAGGVNFFKCALAALVFWAASLVLAPDAGGSPRDWTLIALSGVLGMTIGDLLLFVSVRLGGVQRALVIMNTSPLIAALGAIPFYGEVPTLQGWLGIGVVLVGVSLVELDPTRRRARVVAPPEEPFALGAEAELAPREGAKGAGGASGEAGTDASHSSALGQADTSLPPDEGSRARAGDAPAAPAGFGATLAALGAATGQAAGILLARGPLQEMPLITGSAVRLTAAVAGLALLLALTAGGRAQLRALGGRQHWPRLLLASTIGTLIAVLFMMLGIREVTPGVAAALLATSPIFALPVARFVLKERLGLATAAGTALVVGGVALLALAPRVDALG